MDSTVETEWWYCLKDDLFDISLLKAKRRYEINQGNKNYDARRISPIDYIDRINFIRQKKFDSYPEEYQVINNPESVKKAYSENYDETKWISIGAFDKETGMLDGYLDINVKDGYLDFVRMCVDPDCENKRINFALVCKMVETCKEYIEKGMPICDGQRNLKHKTAFQDWLIRYFGFRKAYCDLHVKLTTLGKMVYTVLHPFVSLFTNSKYKVIYDISVFLRLYDCSCESKEK